MGPVAVRAARRGHPSPWRRRWERRWQKEWVAGYCWLLDRAPDELIAVVEHGAVAIGSALDLGCGSGVATSYLARHVPRAVGIDVAAGAISRARRLAEAEGAAPAFVQAEAPRLPFRHPSFDLVFDRGCLQAIPRARWPEYFRDIEDIVRPGGILQLFLARPVRRPPPIASWRGIRARSRWLLGRGRAGVRRVLGRPRAPAVTADLLARLAGPGLRLETYEVVEYSTPRGPARPMTFASFRKGPERVTSGPATRP